MEKAKMSVFYNTEKGQIKRRNEDFIFTDSSEIASFDPTYGVLYILADGFGGNINSNLACKELVQDLALEYYAQASSQKPDQALRNAIIHAQKHLKRKAEEWNTPNVSIGLAIVLTLDSKALVVNLGGGRIAIATNLPKQEAEIRLFSSDSQPVQDTQDPKINFHTIEKTIERICMISDGFDQWLEDKELKELFSRYRRKSLIERLFSRAILSQSEDNLSAIVAESGKAPKPGRKVNLIPWIILMFAILCGYLIYAYGLSYIKSWSSGFNSKRPEISFEAKSQAPITITQENPPPLEESIPPSQELIPPPPTEEVAPPPPPPPPSPSPTPPAPVVKPAPVPTPPPVPAPAPAPIKYQKVKIAFASQPVGAKVYINGAYQGTTPFQMELPIGPHKILYSKPLYGEKTETLNVSGDLASQSFSLQLRMIAYPVNIRSNPADAKIYINGQYYALTPHVLELKPGTWTLTISKPGFVEHQQTILIEDNQDPSPRAIQVNLLASTARIQPGWWIMECAK
jgi:serine/threonine protein phosphatase PrpC